MEIVQFKGNRWKVVDENGKTLDDAQGYGFTTKGAAKRCWDFKQKGYNKNSAKEFKKKIRSWWYDHNDLYDFIEDELWVNCKDGTPLKESEIVEMTRSFMSEHKIEKPEGLHTWQLVKYMF